MKQKKWKDCNTLSKRFNEYYSELPFNHYVIDFNELPFYSFEVNFGYLVYKGSEYDISKLLDICDVFDNTYVFIEHEPIYYLDKDDYYDREASEEKFYKALDIIQSNLTRVADFIGNNTTDTKKLSKTYEFYEIEKETLDKIKKLISKDSSDNSYVVIRVDGLENFKKLVKKDSEGVWNAKTNRHFKDSDFKDCYLITIFTEDFLSTCKGV